MKLRLRSSLRRYQLRMVRIIKVRKKVLLALLMGAGKTVIVLTALRDLMDTLHIRKALIVAPKTVATDTWPDEIEAWEHTRVLPYVVAVGNEKQRLEAIFANKEITIINRENIPWLVRTFRRLIKLQELRTDAWRSPKKREQLKALEEWAASLGVEVNMSMNFAEFYDCLIYDEASRLKSGKTRVMGREDGKRPLSEFGSVCYFMSKFDYVIELSGTPSPNGLIDLWGPIYLLDFGRRLGSSLSAFKKRWFIESKYTHKVEAQPFAFRQIMERVKDVMFSLDPDDYPDLPPITFNTVKVKLKEKHLAEYRRFKRTLVSELYDVEAVNSGVLTGKLLQFGNGSMYRNIEGTETPQREVVEIHDRKLDALESIIEEAAGEQVLIAYSFDFDREKIRKRFPKVVLFDEEPNFVKKWNRGEIGLGLVHPQSAGHGLNLQYGGSIAVWYGLTWSLEVWQQFNKRLHRPGQEKPVFIHVIVAEGTDDERVLDVLSQKESTQDAVIEAVRLSVNEAALTEDCG